MPEAATIDRTVTIDFATAWEFCAPAEQRRRLVHLVGLMVALVGVRNIWVAVATSHWWLVLLFVIPAALCPLSFRHWVVSLWQEATQARAAGVSFHTLPFFNTPIPVRFTPEARLVQIWVSVVPFFLLLPDLVTTLFGTLHLRSTYTNGGVLGPAAVTQVIAWPLLTVATLLLYAYGLGHFGGVRDDEREQRSRFLCVFNVTAPTLFVLAAILEVVDTCGMFYSFITFEGSDTSTLGVILFVSPLVNLLMMGLLFGGDAVNRVMYRSSSTAYITYLTLTIMDIVTDTPVIVVRIIDGLPTLVSQLVFSFSILMVVKSVVDACVAGSADLAKRDQPGRGRDVVVGGPHDTGYTPDV